MTDGLYDVIMPLMGEGITEATVVKWLKKVGDSVRKDEPLIEVSTDKVDTEIPASHAGFLLGIYAEPGQSVAVNRIIAHIGESKDTKIPDDRKSAVTSPTSSSAKEKSSGASTRGGSTPQRSLPATTTRAEGPLRSSPLVRRIAHEMNLNLAAVQGRGVAGRITRADVLEFLHQIRQETGLDETQVEARIQTQVNGGKEYLEGVEVKRVPMTKMRGLIAEHMVRSVRTSPHVTTTFEMDMHRMVAYRENKGTNFAKTHDFKLTYTHLLAHAVAQTIVKHPLVNSSVDGNDILMKEDINLGVAVAIESGLIVPVVKKAQAMDLAAIGAAIQDLAQRARNKKLNPEDVQGGTFSITNPGLFGSLHSNPIINQPQVAILSVGAIIKRPVVVNDEIVIRPMIQIGLTFDHRVVDGEGGAKFLADLKTRIESYDI